MDQPAAGTLQQSAADMAEKKRPRWPRFPERLVLATGAAGRPEGESGRALQSSLCNSAISRSARHLQASAHERLHPRSSLAPRQQQQPRETRRVEAG